MTARSIDELTDDSIICRVKGHRWQPHTAVPVRGGFDVTEACERCSAERRTDLTNRGTVRSRRISYPHGYLLTGNGPFESSDRDAMRLTVLRWDFPDLIGRRQAS